VIFCGVKLSLTVKKNKGKESRVALIHVPIYYIFELIAFEFTEYFLPFISSKHEILASFGLQKCSVYMDQLLSCANCG